MACAICDGIAKPAPANDPLLVMMKVLIPTNSPCALTSGAAGVARIDGRVGLNEVARLARIIRVRVRPVDRAHDAARDGELEVAERAAEGQHRLPRLKLRRVAPRDGGQIGRVHLDHREVGELVGADDLAR